MLLEELSMTGASASVANSAASTHDPSLFINRELSWLDFDERVLEEARDPTNPLLEQLRFLAISASNLDEFFEVRVAGLQAQLYDSLEPQDMPPDGLGPLTQLTEIARRARDFVARQFETWLRDLRPQLAKHGILVCENDELTDGQKAYLDDYFDTQVYPVLTPLAIDPAHPFPHLHNKSLNLILRIETIGQEPVRQLYAVLQVPSVLARVVRLPDVGDGQYRFVMLESVIAPRLDVLFGGFKVADCVAFRVTRNSDLTIQETEVKSSLLSTVQETLRMRKWGAAVRLEIDARADEGFFAQLQSAQALDLDERDVYKVAGPVDLTVLAALAKIEGFRELKDPPYEPQVPAVLANGGDIFAAIREQDLLVHHPYESFEAVIQFVEQAAEDPNVLAIKQTLYRTADANPIITALARAAENGKQVTALVELQARLDEENNIVKARALQKGGRPRRLRDGRAQDPLQGLPGRPSRQGWHPPIRPPRDRQLQPDDRASLHRPQLLHLPPRVRRGRQRPLQPADRLLARPRLEEADRRADELLRTPDRPDRPRAKANAEAGKPARIIAKVNALVDPHAIVALVAAGRAGVRIDLIVRGICCLRPGIVGCLGQYPGDQHRRQVPRTLADRLLPERHRPRGLPLLRRLDAEELQAPGRVAVPDRRPAVAEPGSSTASSAIALMDNVKARELQPDGTYRACRSPRPGEPTIRSQVEFQNMARELAVADPIRPNHRHGHGLEPPVPDRRGLLRLIEPPGFHDFP